MRLHAWQSIKKTTQLQNLATTRFTISTASIHTIFTSYQQQDQNHQTTSSTDTLDIVQTICENLIKPDFPNNIENLAPQITPSHVSKVISLQQNHPLQALELFKWVAHKTTYKHNVESYMAMVTLLYSCKIKVQANELKMAMIENCGDQIDELMESLKGLEDRGIKPSPLTFVTLLETLAKLGLARAAWRVYLQMVGHRIKPKSGAYNKMINVFCKQGMMDEAMMFFGALVKLSWPPDVFTFTYLISGYCKKGEINEALKALDVMGVIGCDANHVTYSVIIDTLSRRGYFNDAYEYLGRMLAKGIRPDTRTFSALVESLCNAGKIDEALRVLDKMERLGGEQNVAVYNIMLTGLCRQGLILEARKVFDKIPERGLTPTLITYSALIDGYCKSESVDMAFKILSAMEKNGYRANVQIYNELMHGLCLVRRVNEAEGLMGEMRRTGLSPTDVSYTILIEGNVKIGRPYRAFRLFEKMVKEGFKPDFITYKILMDDVLYQHSLEHAERSRWCSKSRDKVMLLLDRMKQHGFEPNVDAYSFFFYEVCKEGKIDVANQLVEYMFRRGVFPDKEILSVARKVDIGEEKSVGCLELLKEVAGIENATKHDVYEGVIIRFFRRNVIVAMRLLESALLKGYMPNKENWSAIFEMLLVKNRADLCVICFTWLKKEESEQLDETYRTVVKQLLEEREAAKAESESGK